jgi:hypothetical protein
LNDREQDACRRRGPEQKTRDYELITCGVCSALSTAAVENAVRNRRAISAKHASARLCLPLLKKRAVTVPSRFVAKDFLSDGAICLAELHKRIV